MTDTSEPLWTSRGYLPHFHANTVQAITYRLADSLPARVLANLDRELERTPENHREQLRRQRIDAYLDAGYGSCVLARPQCARIVIENWQHFDGQRYRLLAWVVMPNHVHVLIETLAPWRLDAILHGWKSYTAKKILALLGKGKEPAGRRRSQVWQREYWDRHVRDERHYAVVVDYIHDNPVKAGLIARAENWPYSIAGGPGSAGGPPAAITRRGKAPALSPTRHRS